MALAVVVTAAFFLTGTMAINLHGKRACKCLNWKETYAAGRAQCGQGFEFTRVLGYPKAEYGTPQDFIALVSDSSNLMKLQSELGSEFCESFYKRFDDNKCARVAMDSSPTEWYGKSWCYVSKKCASAIDVAGARVSAKLCEEGADSLLSDMDPDALITYGQQMGFSVPGYFVKVSYPVDRSFFYGATARATALEGSNIAKLKASKKPVLVDKIDEHQDKMIIFGDKVYEMPNSYEGFRCVEGCDFSTAYILPLGEATCLQGTADDLKDVVLARLAKSNLALGFENSTVVHGLCADRGYVHKDLDEGCFKEATLWFVDDVDEVTRTKTIKKQYRHFVKLWQKDLKAQWPAGEPREIIMSTGPKVQCTTR